MGKDFSDKEHVSPIQKKIPETPEVRKISEVPKIPEMPGPDAPKALKWPPCYGALFTHQGSDLKWE